MLEGVRKRAVAERLRRRPALIPPFIRETLRRQPERGSDRAGAKKRAMRCRWEPVVGGLLALLLVPLAGPETNDATRLIKDLDRPFFRSFAFRELLEMNGKPDPKAWVNHVVKCPQPDGTILYAVFKSAGESLDQKMGASNGVAVGMAVLGVGFRSDVHRFSHPPRRCREAIHPRSPSPSSREVRDSPSSGRGHEGCL